MEEKYTILFTEYHYGNITIVVNKDKVRKECERIKSMSKLANENAYMRIEVVNNQTGEIQLTTATIDRNFRIKVNGIVNGVKVNKLVGVSGLLAILGGSWDKLVKFVLRAFNNITDKCACKIYGGATVTFYAK